MSKKYLIPLAMIGTLLGSGAAFAFDQATGEIKTLNAAKHQFTLSDGNAYTVSKQVNLSNYQVGQTVNVTFDFAKGKRVASSLEMTEAKVFQNAEDRDDHKSKQ